ncbi:MAG: MFS transporter [Rhizobiaceae bacterium]|nr:MFS transporter [Rhizobiaceae bacterium]
MIPRSYVVAMVIGCAYFMQNLDTSIVTTALPQMATSMGVAPVELSIAITAYLLSLAIAIPVSGWLADRFGARLVFQIAIAVFTLSSALCGLSSTVLELTAARVMQGFASAMVVPVGRLVLLRSVKKSELVRATAFLTVPSQIGSIAGPVLGGAITTYASWHWVFFMNIPVGILGIVLATIYIDDFGDVKRRPFDWLGFALTAISLALIIYSIELLGRRSDAIWAPLGLLTCGLASGILAILHARRTPHPLLDLSLMKVPTFASTVTAGSLFRVGWGALPFLLPLLFQVVFGMDALASGLLVFASAVGSVLIRIAGPMIIRRLGFRRLLVWNGALAAVTILMCGFFSVTTPTIVIIVVLFISGVFQALQITALNTLAYADVEESQMSSATAIGQLTPQIARAVGVAASAGLLQLSLNWNDHSRLESSDFLFTFATIALISVLAAPLFAKLPRDAGSEISGHRS